MKHEIYCGFTTYHSPYHPLCLCQQFVFFGLKDLMPESSDSCLQATGSTKVSKPCIKGGVLDAELLLDSEMDGMLGRKCLATAKGVTKQQEWCVLFFFSLCRAV